MPKPLINRKPETSGPVATARSWWHKLLGKPQEGLQLGATRNAMLPVVTVMGLEIGRIFAGAVVIETLFGIPGMGRLMVQAVFQRDFPVVQGCVLVMASAVLLINFITDILYAVLDPRIRYDG